jgi:hypothetical protein
MKLLQRFMREAVRRRLWIGKEWGDNGLVTLNGSVVLPLKMDDVHREPAAVLSLLMKPERTRVASPGLAMATNPI